MATRREAAYMGRSHGRCRFPARDQVRQQQNVIPLLMVRRSRAMEARALDQTKAGVEYNLILLGCRRGPTLDARTRNAFLAISKTIAFICMWRASPHVIRFTTHSMALRCRERASSTKTGTDSCAAITKQTIETFIEKVSRLYEQEQRESTNEQHYLSRGRICLA
jgi:hypothetical protein